MKTNNDNYETRKILKTFFGFSSFKGEQEEIIQEVMDNKDVIEAYLGKEEAFA